MPDGSNEIGRGRGFDYMIVGAGFAGSVLAERLAAGLGKRVLLVDKRPHVGGNAYDHYDDAGVLVHRYGPHIFHTAAQRVELISDIGAAVDNRRAQRQETSVLADAVADLDGKLPRRRDNQSIQVPRFCMKDLVQNGKDVCPGFSSAGLRTGDEIVVFQNHRDRLLLNWCRLAEAHGVKTVEEPGVKFKIVKSQTKKCL